MFYKKNIILLIIQLIYLVFSEKFIYEAENGIYDNKSL